MKSLARPAQRALAAAGYKTLADLAAVPAARIAQLHGIGPTALAKLRSAMAEHGLAFADE